MAGERSIESFMSDPDNVPDDPAEIAALMEGGGEAGEGGEPPATYKPEPTGEEEAEAAAAEAELEAGEGEKADEGTGKPGEKAAGEKPGEEGSPTSEEAPVSTADGKHTIPFSVLQAARQKADTEAQARTELEERNKQLQQQLEALQQGSGDAAKAADEAAAAVKAGEEINFDAIEEEYGEDIAKALRASHDRALAAERRTEELQAQSKQREETEADEVANYVQRTIDSIPVLAHWQASDSAMWNAAVAMDNTLRETDEFKNADAETRFTEVAKRLNNGSIEAPGAAPKTTGGKKAESESEDEGEAPPPTSHAELPGGVPDTGKQGVDRVADMSPLEIEASLERMTDDQRERFIADLG